MAIKLTTESGFVYFAQHGAHMANAMWRMWLFSPSPKWQPAINFYETPDAYYICVELAGMRIEDIEVRREQHKLTIQGQRAIPRPQTSSEQVRIHLMEIDHGQFSRELDLPHDVDLERITAKYKDGMLWIELPRRAK